MENNSLVANPLIGVELSDPAEGERVNVMLRIVGDHAAPPLHKPRIRKAEAHTLQRLNSNNIVHRRKASIGGPILETSTYMFPTVFGDQDKSSVIISQLRPLAVGVTSGTSASIVCAKSDALSSEHTLFDSNSRNPAAISLIEMIVEECAKRRTQCYLSIGVIDGAMIYDVLAGPPEAMRPVSMALVPSVVNGSLFPDITETNITAFRRTSEVVHAAVASILRFQDLQTLGRELNVFAIVSVPVTVALPGSRVQMSTIVSRLTLLDIGTCKALSKLLLPEQTVIDPRLEMKPLPLLSYGVGLANRCAVLLSLPAAGYASEVEALKVADELRRTIVFPVNRVHSTSFLFNAEGGYHKAEDAVVLGLMRENLNVKHRLNILAQQLSTQSNDTLADDFQMVLAELHKTSSLLADKLPFAITRTELDDNAYALVNSRIELVRQVEAEQAERQQWLQSYHDWLLHLPTVDGPPLHTAMTFHKRMEVLEKTVLALQQENQRQRNLFARDVGLLKTELAAAQEAAKLREPLMSPFQPVVDSFLEDAELILHSAEQEPEVALKRAEVLIADLAVSLKRNAGYFLDSSSPANTMSSVDACHILFAAATEKMRRSLQIPVAAQPTSAPPSLKYWEDLVFERFACRAERARVKSIAEAVSLQLTRIITVLGDIAKQLDLLGEDGGLPKMQSAGSSTSNAGKKRRAVDALIEAELGVNQAHQSIRQKCSFVSSLPVTYSIEKCVGLAEMLKHVVDGVADIGKHEAIAQLPLFHDRSVEALRGSEEDKAKKTAETPAAVRQEEVLEVDVTLDELKGTAAGATKKRRHRSPTSSSKSKTTVQRGFFSGIEEKQAGRVGRNPST